MPRRTWYNPIAVINSVMIRPSFYLGALTALIALQCLPRHWPTAVRLPVASDIGGLVYLLFTFRLMLIVGHERLAARAARRDDSRDVIILIIILLAIVASFAAIAVLGGQAKLPETGSTKKVALAAVAALTIMISWGVTQVTFAIHYAHEFYRPEDSIQGAPIEFPWSQKPNYFDFLYFSISIGATSQPPDTAIRSRALMRLVSLHTMVAYFFNTAVLALTVNIAASLAL